MSEKFKPTLLGELGWTDEDWEAYEALRAMDAVPEPESFTNGLAGHYPEGRTPSIAELAVDPDYLYGSEEDD